MTDYKLSFQLGDFTLLRKKIKLNKMHKAMALVDKPIKRITELNYTDKQSPQYFPRVFIKSAANIKHLNLLFNQIAYIRSIDINYAINLHNFESFDHYLTKFSAKSRSTLKRKIKNALNSGFTVRVFSKPTDVDIFHKDACLVGNKTYQKKLFNAAIPDTEEFKDKLIEQAVRGELMAIILYCKNKPCAYLYCPMKQQSYVYTYLGYLPKYRRYSPGTVLQYLLLKHIFSLPTRAKYFDFTEGEGEHKRLFSSESCNCCNCLIINNSPSTYYWLKFQLYFDVVSSSLGKILNIFKIKQIVKKLIRS